MFLVCFNGAVGFGVGDAGEDVALIQLVVVEESLVGIVNFASCHLADTGTARSGPARVG